MKGGGGTTSDECIIKNYRGCEKLLNLLVINGGIMWGINLLWFMRVRRLGTTFIIEEELWFGLVFMIPRILFIIVVAKTLRSTVSGPSRRKTTKGNLGTTGECDDISRRRSIGNRSNRWWNYFGSSQNRPTMAQCGFDKSLFQSKMLLMQLGKPNGILKLNWFVDEYGSFKIWSEPWNKTIHQKERWKKHGSIHDGLKASTIVTDYGGFCSSASWLFEDSKSRG